VAYKIIDNDNERCRTWMSEQCNKRCSDMVQTIGLENKGALVAVVGYNCFNGKSCQQHIVVGKSARGTKAFLWFIFHYPFIQLGLEMLIAIMPEDNADIVKMAKQAGFIEEYRIDGAHPDGDLILCTMRRSDCRFLNIRLKG